MSDNKWRLKINIEDSTGASLGVKNVKASEVEGWYNLEDPSSTVRSCGGTINIQVTQRDSMYGLLRSRVIVVIIFIL